MLRAVIDVNVFVSGLLSASSSTSPTAQVVHALAAARVVAVASPDLVSELDEVLHRRKFARRISSETADRVVTEFRRTAEMHYPEEAPQVTRDRKDDYLIALARYAGANVLVTGDRDLLELDVRDVRVLSPAQFMAELDS